VVSRDIGKYHRGSDPEYINMTEEAETKKFLEMLSFGLSSGLTGYLESR
jgi:hypothetical protein